MQRRIITLLITGTVLTAGLIMGFGGYVFAGDPVPGLHITIEQIPGGRVSTKSYDSLLPNKTIGWVRMEVGNVLLGYGVGGADINKVTEALEGGGVYEAELKSFLMAIGMNEKDAQDILLEFDKLGIGRNKEGVGGISTPDATGATTRGADVKKEFSFDRYEEGKSKSMQDLKAAESDDQLKGKVRHELQANRETLQKSAETLRQDLRANAQDLRENFRENVKTTIGHVDHGKTGRIAVAHGKGLRMLNRFRSAMARFDHILGRLESRVQKLEERGADVSSITALIEEAKNMSVENEAKLEELKAKYESLLLGENLQGIGEEARAIAKELKSAIEKLHTLLDDIRQATGTINTTKSNTF